MQFLSYMYIAAITNVIHIGKNILHIVYFFQYEYMRH